MKKVQCKSCKQEIPLIEPYVKFQCPECDEIIYRCEKCRTFGHAYTCECGFEGP
ncbi:MAG: zinc finger domain-containing protein [Methanobacteriaceae archaeon]